MSKVPQRRYRSGASYRACCLAVAPLLLAVAPVAFAQTTATWLSPVSGTWSDPANWSTNPAVPNDPAADALLSATGSPYTVTLNSAAAVGSLTGTSADATLNVTTGGTLTLAGSLDLGPGTLTLSGGKIVGGTVNSPVSTSGGGTLDSVSLAGEVVVGSGGVGTTGTFALSGGSIRLTKATSAVIGSNALSGTGSVVFDNPSGNATVRGGSGSTPFTVGPDITVRTGGASSADGLGWIGNQNYPLVNQGTISAQTPGSTLTLYAGGLTNTGTIEAKNNATVRIYGNTGGAPLTPAALSTIKTTDGGIAYTMFTTVPAFGPNATTLTLSADHAVGLGVSTNYIGSTIASADGTPLTIYSYTPSATPQNPNPVPTGTATLTGVIVSAPVAVRPGATLLAGSGTTLAGPVTLDAGTLTATGGSAITGSVTAANGSVATVANSGFAPSYITLSASTLTIAGPLGSLGPTGPLTLSAGSTLNINYATPTTGVGPVSITDSTVNVNTPLTAAQFAPIANATRTRATINVNAALTNTGSTIPLDANTGPLNIVTTLSSAGSITGGTLGSAAGGGLVVLGTAGVTLGPTPTLQDVTLAGSTLSVASGVYAESRGTLTLSNAHISISQASPLSSYATRFIVDSFAGTGEISFDGTPNATSANTSFTSYSPIPAGVTVRTGSNSGTVNASTIAGTISAQTPGQSIGLNTLSAATGTLSASNLSTLNVFADRGVISFITATHTLSFGSWVASDGGTIHITTSTYDPATHIVPVTTIAAPASATLSGPTASFPSLDALATNSGSFTLTAGRSFTTQGDFTNTGTVTLGPSSTLKVTGNVSNTGTVSLTAATSALLVDYAGASPIDALRADLLAHRLTTPVPGTAVAYAEASQLNVTTYAGLPVDATTLVTKVTAPGDANLDGRVDADDYALLDRALAAGTTNAHWIDGDFDYDGAITSADYLLIDTSYGQSHGLSPALLSTRESQFGPDYVNTLVAAVPEPSLLGCGLVAVATGTRRRRR